MEREELNRLFLGDAPSQKTTVSAAESDTVDGSEAKCSQDITQSVADYIVGEGGRPSAFAAELENQRRKLKIYRKRLDEKGREYVNVEVKAFLCNKNFIARFIAIAMFKYICIKNYTTRKG